MATGINLSYNVNTPPIVPEKWQGQIISLIGRQYRFSTFEPLANGTLEAGVFVTGSVDSLGILKVSKPTTAGTKILGVTALNFQRFLSWDSVLNCFNYADNDIVTLVQEGDIVMYAEVAVDVGDPVFLRHTSDASLTRIGALSKTSGTGKEAIPGAKFLDQTSAAGLVRVSLPDII